MFRNPRENATLAPGERLRPAVGRPPSPAAAERRTPHPEPATHKILSNPMSTPTLSRQTSIAASFSKARSQPQQQNGKPKNQRNANILNFFQKVDSPNKANAEGDVSLFLDESPVKKGASGSLRIKSSEWPSAADPEEVEDQESMDIDDDASRFNENRGSVKRRRLSQSFEATTDAEIFDSNVQKPCSPPPPDIDHEPVVPSAAVDGSLDTVGQEPRSSGPFLEDSDSEEEVFVPRPQLEEAQMPEEATEVGSTTVDHERSVQEQVSIGGPMPQLKREETSYPGEDEFGDLEGDEDYDEYEEGEEFLQRRFMEEQKMLEMEQERLGANEDDFDAGQPADGLVIKSEDTDQDPSNDQAGDTPQCPICSLNLAGVSDQVASVHVNNCLDGNPTPLPNSQQQSSTAPAKDAPVVSTSSAFRRPFRPPKPGQENPFNLAASKGTSSAFSKLMTGHAEDEAWAAAAAAEHASRGRPSWQRTCPFYKILPGFYICVDAFRYGAVEGCKAYFLSHFHSDHYVGLTATWSHGPIYCSRPTANLVKQQLRVDPKYVIELEWETKLEVPGTRGVFVTMIPANHCPGSSLYLFEKELSPGQGNQRPRTQCVLHCGDFRACPAHVEHPLLKPEVVDMVSGRTQQQKIDVCYLDTTYLNPKYAFPSQEDVIKACADMCLSLNKSKVDRTDNFETMKRERAGTAMNKFVQREALETEVKQENQESISNPHDNNTQGQPKPPPGVDRTRGPLLVVVGTYSIGKERICLGIARALNSLIYAPAVKQRICAALEDAELNSRLTSDPRAAQVHMTPLFEIRAETLADYLTEYSDRFSRAVGFRPSGWTYRPPGSRFTESPSVPTVLYSENWKSSYSMRELVPQRGSNSRASVYGVPYSEHSSFRELTMFCCALNIDRVIPTVNVGSKPSRDRMKAWIDRWAQERAKNGLFRARREGEEAGGEGKGDWYADRGTWELRTTL